MNAESHIARRQLLLGGASAACLAATPANAALPAVMAGIGFITSLWNGFKVGEEIYDRMFKPEKKQSIIVERERIFVERQFIVVPQLLEFRNIHKFREFNGSAPGCHCYHQKRPEHAGLFFGGTDDAVAITSGFAIILASAMGQLRSRYAEDNTAAYTQPLRYFKKPEPWRAYGESGRGVATEMSYYSPAGTVVLQWGIPNARGSNSYAYCNIRDNSSGRVVADFDGYFDDRG
jgi:hypothetical protein